MDNYREEFPRVFSYNGSGLSSMNQFTPRNMSIPRSEFGPWDTPLPFYMAYPGYMRENNEDAMLRDFEYFQELYPVEVKRSMRKVSDTLDRIDFEGSMIYDEYPDRYRLQRLVQSILRMLQLEEQEENPDGMMEENTEKWLWMEWLIYVLLTNEIYKRRHGGNRGFLNL